MNKPQEPIQPTERYEVCNAGPLTYFRYYFEDLTSADDLAVKATPLATPTKPFKPVVLGLVGVGLAATAVTGVAIANHSSQENSSTSPKQSNGPKTDPDNLTSQSKVSPATPEAIAGKTFSNSGLKFGPAPQSNSSLKASNGKPSTTSPPGSQAMPNPNPSAESLNNDLPKSPLTVSVPEMLPLPSLPPLKVSKQSLTATKTVAPSPVAAAKPAPTKQATVTTRQTASTTQLQQVPVSYPVTESARSTVTATDSSSKAMQVAKEFAAPAKPLSSGEFTPLMPTSVQPATVEPSSPTNLPNATSSQATNNSTAKLPAKIQDFLAFPQRSGRASSIRLLPLTQQAAVEVQSSQKIDQYTVYKLATQDYQKEWQASSKTPEIAEVPNVLPTYGFIDYQRQMIVVLQDSTNQNGTAQVSLRSNP